MADSEHSAGKCPFVDEVVEDAVGLVQPAGAETDLLRGGGTQGHRAPRDLEPGAVGVVLRERHRQPAADVDLTEQRGDGRAAAGFGVAEGAEGSGRVGDLCQEVGIAERGDDHRQPGLFKAPEEPEQTVGDRLPIVGGRHQDVGGVS